MNELVYLKNDEAVCDSLQVAEKFGKEHKNVLQSIDNLIAENSAVKIMFKISSYKSGNGQSYRKFYMNRDGFSLLAMGFTGKEALEWKLQYIRAFNQMENFIREKSTQMWVETRKAGKLTRKAETDTIQKLVEYAKGQGSSHAEMLYMTSHRFLTALIPFLTASCGFPAASLSITRLLKIVDTPFYNFSLLPHCFNQTNTQKSVITHDRK